MKESEESKPAVDAARSIKFTVDVIHFADEKNRNLNRFDPLQGFKYLNYLGRDFRRKIKLFQREVVDIVS